MAALALGTGGLAGCTTAGPLGGDAPDRPSYAGWLYDPTPLMDVDNRVYATFDVQSLYENRELLPAGLFETFAVLDDALDAVAVDELEHATTIAYSQFDPAAWSSNPESALTIVVDGGFDADAIDAELAALDGVADAGSHGEYSLHTTSFDWDLGSFGEHTASITVATATAALVVGVTFDLDEAADPLETVTRPIDTHADAEDAETVLDVSADARDLVTELGETTFGIGVDVRADLLDNMVDDADRPAVDAAAKDVVGLGLDLDFDGDDLRGDTILVFDDADAASEHDVEALVAETDGDRFGDATVSADGRVATVTSRVDAERLWSEYWPDVALGSDESDDGDGGGA